MNTFSTERQQLRETLRQKRNEIHPKERIQYSMQVAEQFIKDPIFIQSQHIAVYLSFDAELDPQPILNEIWLSDKHSYLPVLNPHEKKHLVFVHYEKGDTLKPNGYGILQPKLEFGKNTFPIEKLDIILLPLVGFDQSGVRLGMGAGYYDRTFEFKLSHSSPSKPFLIGLGYELQKCDTLSHESWDVPLDGVITEQQFYRFTTFGN